MTVSGTNSAQSRRFNRRLVFDLIRGAGPISRIDIAGRSALRAQTISNIARELLDRGLILEAGRSEGRRGPPQTYLTVNPRAGFTIGLHLDRQWLSAVVGDLGQNRLLSRRVPAESIAPEEAARAMAALVETLVAEAGIDRALLWGVGLATPTLQDGFFEEYVGSPGWEAWIDFPIADRLQALSGLPVVVENDATAAAVGELYAGHGRGLRHFVYLFVGYGTGAGVILDGKPFEGAWNNAGEIGLVAWPNAADTVERGEAALSLDVLARLMGEPTEALLAPGRLEALYERRETALMRWLDHGAPRLRFLVSVIENLFDPETILVGGLFPDPVIRSLIDRAYPLHASVSARRDRTLPRLVAGGLSTEAPVTGAAILPIFTATSPDFQRLSLRRGRTGDQPFDAILDGAGRSPR